jgi:hypothetical protein
MLGLIRRAKYTNVAVAPAEQLPTPPRDQLTSSVRTQYLKLTHCINASLEPKRHAHTYADRVLQKLGYDNVLRAVAEGKIFEFTATAAFREIVSQKESFCLDFPEESFSNAKMFESRHMPIGLAVIAAIMTEVTRSPVDMVFSTYQRWHEFVDVVLGRFRENACTTRVTKVTMLVNENMQLLVNSVLNPMIERYQLYDRKRLRRVIYRRYCVHRMFNWEVIDLLHTMVHKLRTDNILGELFRMSD